MKYNQKNKPTKLEEKTSDQKQAKRRTRILEEKTSNKKQNSVTKTKPITNTYNPGWLVPKLDLTRDRKPYKRKNGKGGLKLGNARKHALDQKRDRLFLQEGEEQEPAWEQLESFSIYVKELADKIIYQQAIHVIETLSIFIYFLSRSRNIMDIIVTVANMVKNFTKKNLLTTEHINNLKNLFPLIDMQVGERETIDSFKELLRDWTRLRKSPLIKKITQVLLYMTTIGFYHGPLPANVAKRVESVANTYSCNRLEFAQDFVFYMLDLLHFVCDKAYGVIYEGEDPKGFLVSNLEYDMWLDKAQEYIAKGDFLSDPITHGIDIHNYLFEIRKLIEAGRTIHKYSCDLDKTLRTLVSRKTFDLQKIEMRILSRESAQAMRQAPFAVVIEGPSSVGKSKIAEIIHVYFGKLYNKPLNGCERYVKSATSKYWDGFSADQWSLFMDDVAMWNSDLNMIDESVMDIVRIINNMPFMPDMAALEDKGKTPCKAELVVVTTNVPGLKLNEYFTYPFAAARRLPWHIRVKPKHTIESFMLDTDKTELEPGEVPDDWLFDILKPVPKENGNKVDSNIAMMRADLVLEAENLSMQDLLCFINVQSSVHRRNQERFTKHSTSLNQIKLCKFCQLPTNLCCCTKNQVGVDPISLSIFAYTMNYLVTRMLDFLIFHSVFPSFCEKLYSKFEPFLRLRLRELQNKARDKYYEHCSVIKPTVITLSLCSVLGFLLIIYKTFLSVRKQGAKFSSWGTTYPDLNERENVWQKEPYVVDTFDSTATSLSMGGLNSEKCKDIISKSCAYLRFQVGGKWLFCRLLNLKGQKFITPNHCLPEDGNLYCQIIRGYLRDKRGDQHYFTLSQSQIQRYPDKDLCLITIPSVSNGKDITELFIKEKAVHRGPMIMLKREKNGDIIQESRNFTSCDYISNNPLNGIKIRVWKTPDLETYSGDCGAVVYRIDDMGLRILGIHESYQTNLLSSNCACAILLTYEFIKQLPLEKEVGVVQPQLGLYDEEVILQPISESSCLRSLEEGTLNVYGRVTGINRPRSKVKKTLLCDKMLDLGFKLEYGQPVMSTQAPWRLNISKQVQADTFTNWDDLLLIKKQMLNQWKQALPQFSEEVKILDFDTVINGKPGVKYIDAIPRKTSAGFPFMKSKMHYIRYIDSEPGSEKVEFTDQIMDKVFWRLDQYKKGNRTKPVFRASLKDEATSFAKIQKSKTRIFMGAPVDFTICMRSLLLSFVRISQKNKFIFESAPGLEAQCIEWDELYHYLTSLGEERMIFGDFSGFDTSMRSNIMRLAFDLIEDFHRCAGATEEHCKMIRALSYDIIFPLVEFNGDLIELNGKNPSGHPLTVTINGIVNCICIRYCYLKLNPKREVDSFRDNVKLITYGDDNGMGVSEDVPWFNHTEVSRVMLDLGMTYTMADKNSESIPYIHISDGDFLKRKWRYCEDTFSMVCPLRQDSITKSLMIGLKSKNISEREHAASVIYSAHLEFFWHGRETFETWSELLQSFIDDFHLDQYMPGELKTWEQLVQDYHDRSNTYLALQVGEETRSCHHCGLQKSVSLFSQCGHCKLVDQCMTCHELTDDILLNISPPLWFCRDCDYTFFWDFHQRSFIRGLLYNAYQAKLQQEGSLDLPLDGFDHTSIVECARLLDWDGRFYASMPSAQNDQVVDGLDPPSTLTLQGSQNTSNDNNTRVAGAAQNGPASSATADVVRNMTPNNETVDYTSSQTVTFTETEPGEVMEFLPTEENTSFIDRQPNLELNKFFERPTLIKTLTWGSGGLDTEFFPWTDFLTNTYIENKLKNYALFRGDLHIKFVISANPFTYGATLVSYTPIQTVMTDSIEETTSAVQNTQKPHIWIYPQNNAGGELVLPFFYKSNYVNILLTDTTDALGEIRCKEIIALDTANDSAIPDLTIQVYAWCTNVYLAAPTTQLILQAGEEYKQGPVQRVATRIAGVAQTLSQIPLIQPFAMATNIASEAVAGIASLFGWSKPILIEGARGVIQRPYLGFASSDVSNVMDKLALDQKAELSVDPRIVNLSGQDELSLNYLLQKEAYVCNSNWLSSDAVGAQLFELPVWPLVFQNTDNTTHRTCLLPPLAYFAALFRYWRGDIIFRFRLIASQYHRGRIRITYEPKGEVGSSDYSNIAITQVVDITEQNDIEFRVPYTQEFPWCKSDFDPGNSLGVGTTFDKTGSAAHVEGYTNGTIRVQVLTTLSSPQASPSCHIIAFIKGGDNCEVAVPTTDFGHSHSLTHLELQVGSEGDIVCGQSFDKRYLINHGEQIASLRQVLSRASLSEVYNYWNLSYSNNDMRYFYLEFNRFPSAPGFNSDAYLQAADVIGAGNSAFTFSLMHPINWVAPCFAACRGGVQVNFAFNYPMADSTDPTATIHKKTTLSITSSDISTEFKQLVMTNTADTHNENKASVRSIVHAGTSGISKVKLKECSNVGAELVDQHQYLFYSTRQEQWLLGSSWDDTDENNYRVAVEGSTYSATNTGALAYKYYNIAPDFNLHFFVCTPTVYYSDNLGDEPSS